MNDDHNTLDEVINQAREGWIAIIECTNCGYRGQMASSHEPRDETVWTCEQCDSETVHETLMSSSAGEDIER